MKAIIAIPIALATTFLVFDITALAKGLPSALTFGGIPWWLTWQLAIKRKKIHVRDGAWWTYFSVTMLILSIVFFSANSMDAMHPTSREDAGFFVAVIAFAIVFSITSCMALRWQEQKRNGAQMNISKSTHYMNETAYKGHLALEGGEPPEANPYPHDSAEYEYWYRGYQAAKSLKKKGRIGHIEPPIDRP